MVRECARQQVAFVPFAPLGSGASGPNSVLGAPQVVREAGRLGIPPAHVALAWLMAASPNVLLIPGTSSIQHLRENLQAAALKLHGHALERLNAIARSPKR